MKKAQLLVAIEPLQRGLLADEDTVEAIDKLASELERMNPTKEPLNSEVRFSHHPSPPFSSQTSE